MSYGREMTALGAKYMRARPEGNPNHRLVVHHLKGAWTTSNREVAFALFDSFMKNKVHPLPVVVSNLPKKRSLDRYNFSSIF